MKSRGKLLRVAALAYLALWGLSALAVYPARLVREIDSERRNVATQPAIIGRSICFAPALSWVDWQEGDRGFDCAGYRGVFFATPFGVKMLWKQMAWVS